VPSVSEYMRALCEACNGEGMIFNWETGRKVGEPCEACNGEGQETEAHYKERLNRVIVERLKGDEQEDGAELFGPPEIEAEHGVELSPLVPKQPLTLERAKYMIMAAVLDELPAAGVVTDIEGKIEGRTINVTVSLRGLPRG